MNQKQARQPLTAGDIQEGHVYRGKRRVNGSWADRTVLYVGHYTKHVQYDSRTVPAGETKPTVTMKDFLAWASHEVPVGELAGETQKRGRWQR